VDGGTVAVTGAAGPLGQLVLERLVAAGRHKRVVGIDVDRGTAPGVTWRLADVRDPALRARLAGVDTVVHLATDRDPESAPADRRALNVRGTDVLLTAAAAAGVRRLVLLTSAMVYGAGPDNAVPLPEDGPLRAEPDLTLVGDWVEMERLATRAARAHPSLQVVRVRPASLSPPSRAPAKKRGSSKPRASWKNCTDNVTRSFPTACCRAPTASPSSPTSSRSRWAWVAGVAAARW